MTVSLHSLVASLLLLATTGAQAAALDAFDLTVNAAIPGYNVETLGNVTPEACAAACTSSTRQAWCRSFDYKKSSSACDLSDKRAGDVGGLKTDYAGSPYDHYSLRPAPLERFVRTPNAAIAGFNTETLPAVVTPADCAAACTDAGRPWCKSFDYHKGPQRCDLSDHRATDVAGLKTDYAGNPYDHYALPPLDGIPTPVPGNKRVLLIGIDGLRGDAVNCSGCVATPALAALIAGGAFHGNVRAGGSQATLSGPGWGTVFTGHWAADHGVTSNDITLPLRKPHVFDLLKQSHPTATAAVIGDWPNITQNLRPVHADWVTVNAAKNSQQATDAAKALLALQHPPTATFVYYHRVDIHAPSYDPLSPTYRDAIAAEDAQIAQLLATLTARSTYAQEDWLVIVTSDHGGTGSGHGGQTDAERRTLLVLNNRYGQPGKPAYCSGDLTATPLLQIDGATPHILDFLRLPNPTPGRKHPACTG